MWRSSRESRRAQVRRRLTTAAGGWVPTVELVQEELAGHAVPPADGQRPPASGGGATSVPWDDDASERPRRRVEPAVLPAVLLVVVGAVVGALVLWLLAWPRGTAAPTALVTPWSTVSAAGSESPGPQATGTATTPGVVVVDVAGAVRRPGVVELPTGSRVVDALAAAGGPLPRSDTTPLNLARVLADGEQVLVPVRGGAGGGAPGPTSPGAGTTPTQVDLNTATLEQLDVLPGIGPVLAQRILDWRAANGGFASVDQLRDVSGIGDATFAELEPLVRV